MKKQKPLWIIPISYMIILLLIPAVILLPFSSKEQKTSEQTEDAKVKVDENAPVSSELTVSVFRDQSGTVEEFELETYVAGVVASEMPASFEEEALKAQALAARTYVTRLIAAGGAEGLPEKADITDTTAHQVFKNDKELKSLWSDEFEWKKEKIAEAVSATKGEVLTYDGKPITASFFSTSNGWTENAKDYWTEDIPYLQSVESSWDESVAPEFLHEVTIPVSEFEEKLGITLSKGEIGTVMERTPGHRVKTVDIAGQTFTGRDIREKLGLRSTDFHWTQQGDSIIIQTKGYGHGVGMSQYGANGMAKEGKTYGEIVTHYFKGVEIASVETVLPSLLAQR
ncbi:stage II sporulation protein D [Jeotgalibacillus sp. ET6]|uniref:stage II sporulation protein D n=1 Tax=Jeotgalibacillus sp. ET6 TaxID=3037260 RepID=UPI0024189D9C|nr:stage II sporulation protein D [Jeotgalibacillus sp. ET6]MDG5471203.1 stage II sporulation protein D [Jeotgalibacillus sp. ET6]